MDRPTSFSQNIMFEKCSRSWYLSYIKKIPSISDMSYAYAGSILHTLLEKFYKGEITEIEKLKDEFESLWGKQKFNDVVRNKKESYWLMFLNGIALKKTFTSLEMKIFFPDVVAYIDGVDTNNDEIVDWKSSTRSTENEEEYKKQLLFYSYLYYRKFERLPKRAVVYYLKYSGSKGQLEINPTMEDIKQIEDWHFKIREEMGNIILDRKTPPRCSECFFFCPYPNLCNGGESVYKFTLNIRGNFIYIDGPFTDLLNKGLVYNFSYELKNAYFIKKKNPNINTIICFWKQNRRQIPLAFKDKLIEVLQRYADYKKKELAIDINDERKFSNMQGKMPEKFINDKVLRDYQKEAVETFLRKKIGILEVGTGGGKTEIAIELIRRLNMNTLFIVDKIELLKQTKKRIEDSLGITVGQIGAGKQDIKLITVATVQTITKHLSTLAPYLRLVRFAIFDETHKVAAKSYWKIAQQLTTTEFRLGISGTAFRDDGNDMMIHASTGYKCFDLSGKKLIDRGWLVKPNITFYKNFLDKDTEKEIERGCKEGLINETPNYSNYYNGFINQNNSRNNIILYTTEMNKGKKILILTKLIEHGQRLKEMIPDSEHLYGATNKTEREDVFNKFNNGEIKVLISTISIFAEGIDIPSLDIVINASANKGDVKTIQVLGRVLRKMQGKQNAHYYDFWDSNSFFRVASMARKKALVREGHDIEMYDFSQHLNIDNQ